MCWVVVDFPTPGKPSTRMSFVANMMSPMPAVAARTSACTTHYWQVAPGVGRAQRSPFIQYQDFIHPFHIHQAVGGHQDRVRLVNLPLNCLLYSLQQCLFRLRIQVGSWLIKDQAVEHP